MPVFYETRVATMHIDYRLGRADGRTGDGTDERTGWRPDGPKGGRTDGMADGQSDGRT